MAKPSVRTRVVSNKAVVINAIDKAMKRKVMAMGVEGRKTLLTEVLVGQRTGRWYTLPGTKGRKKWRASRPGEPPATRLGDLRRSYKLGKLEVSPGRVQIKLGNNLVYAPILEGPMDRAHLEPALRLAKPKFEQILMGEWGI